MVKGVGMWSSLFSEVPVIALDVMTHSKSITFWYWLHWWMNNWVQLQPMQLLQQIKFPLPLYILLLLFASWTKMAPSQYYHYYNTIIEMLQRFKFVFVNDWPSMNFNGYKLWHFYRLRIVVAFRSLLFVRPPKRLWIKTHGHARFPEIVYILTYNLHKRW